MKNYMLKYISCPVCNRTLENIEEEKKIGCTTCLSIFREAIISMLKEKAEDVVYKGKNKGGVNFNRELPIPIEKLKELLQKSVEVEDYEAAISFRNEIKKLEQT